MSGSQCCEDPPRTLADDDGRDSRGEKAGLVAEIGGLWSYVNGPTDANSTVIQVSDLFGYEAPKLRKIADKFAECGYYVVVPDFFDGYYYDPNNAERPIPVWLQSHDPVKVSEGAKPVFAALRDKGVSSIGAAGLCWGDVRATIAVLGAEHDWISPPELLKQFKEVDEYVKIFPGVVVGWAVRYKDDDEVAVKGAQTCMIGSASTSNE